MSEPAYLAELGLTAEQDAALAGLGASSAAALMSMWMAAPEAFERLLGSEQSTEIRARLDGLLTPEERKRLEAKRATRSYSFGASLKLRSHLPAPAFDVEERDRLFAELESLRKGVRVTAADQARIEQLEATLKEMLEGGSRGA